MNMRRHIFLLFALLSFLSALPQGRRDRVESLRVAYITRQVGLSEKEAREFWPVYNEYTQKLRAARRDVRRTERKYSETLDESAVKELFKEEQRARRAEYEVHAAYSEKIKDVLGYRKYMRLRAAEEKFRQEIVKRLREGAGDED